jgi:hypothetical protein
MATHSWPEDGDLVIGRERSAGARVYVLYVSPGPDQLMFRVREDAIAHALRLAERQSVRIWLTDDGDEFAVLENFRVAESV